MNATLELLQERSSLRTYDTRPVSLEHKDQILKATLRAPTAGNMMLYTIISIEDQETKNRLVQTCDNQPFIAKAPWCLLFLADVKRFYDYYELCRCKEYAASKGQPYLGPTIADLFISLCDALIAAQSAVIAAESLGLGTCYIGDIMENYETHKELFSLPDYAFPITLLTLGYPPPKYTKKLQPRFPQEFIVHKETYCPLQEVELKSMFAKSEKSFPKENQWGAENFGQYMYARKSGASFFQEMRRSIQEAMKNWQ